MTKDRVKSLVGTIYRHPWLVLLGVLLVTCASGWATYTGLKIKSGIKDLLPESAPSVQAMDTLNERLGSVDMLVVALMSNDFDTVKPMLPRIAKALKAHPDISDVQWRNDIDLIDDNALIIFPTLDELKADYKNLRDRIKQEVKKRMRLLDEDEKPKEEEKADGFETYTFSWAEHEQMRVSNLGRTFRQGRGKYPVFPQYGLHHHRT